MTADELCDWCEEVLQPYLDRDLNEADQATVKGHLARCKWCNERYKFEDDLRHLVRQSVVEPMAPALKARLSNLRLEL
jgi:anti-sigma factor (TIGR02949 family)